MKRALLPFLAATSLAVAQASLPAIPSSPAPQIAGTEAGATPSAASRAVVPLTLTLVAPAPAQTAGFALGTARNPSGSTIAADNRSLLLDGQPWTPVMGEFHYARYPAAEWREELLKMKAGGIAIVATYVFWIHHEETAGQWDWSGARDLRHFVDTAREVGLKVIVRCGPWCHGEVRNGGLPDWVVARGGSRSDDPTYLASVATLYAQIAAQLRGLLWKDGGPVVGLQLENEYWGPAEHLLTLKRLAREAGLDTPLYTRTGWPALKTPIPFGEILPLYGVYAEGFWDRELTSMPGSYWAGFHFSTLRTDAAIANEALGRRETRDAPDIARYPYLTCEIGGGMMSAYHRRILVDPRDIEATTLVKLGSGSTSPGYYMYHGGTNPEGRQTTLMEEQSTAVTNWNDMPVKNYDFQAPLGQYGQVRPQYHILRRLHSFLHAYGPDLAGMAVALPDKRPTGRDDVETLRWSVRSDGVRGFLFVNNHERGRTLPAKQGVQFLLSPGGLSFPSQPATIPSGAAFLWPFGLDLGGVTLAYATAQPLTYLDSGNTRTVFFAATPGVPAEFAFAEQGITGATPDSRFTRHDGRIVFRDVQPGRGLAFRIQAVTGKELQIILLNEPDSLALWQGPWRGRERVFLSGQPLVFDDDQVRATAAPSRSETRTNFEATTATDSLAGIHADPGQPEPILVFPSEDFAAGGEHLPRLFAPVPIVAPTPQITTVASVLLKSAGPLRTITLGRSPQPVAAAPVDADFANAAVWRLNLPADLDLSANPLLRLCYVGDVARVYIGNTFVMDDYSNGEPLEIGLARHAEQLKAGELTVAILPLQNSAPILRPVSEIPTSDQSSEAVLTHAEIITRPTVEF
ncbi:MAG: beta-galactosidase [Opitutaceae bacterium]|nr:beta-galactosidase [Opitutaceae bacterium]